MSTLNQRLAALKADRGTTAKRMNEIAAAESISTEMKTEFDNLKAKNVRLVEQIQMIEEVSEIEVGTKAQPVNDDLDDVSQTRSVHATVESDPYVTDPSLQVGALLRMYGATKGDADKSLTLSKSLYGERHPVVKSLGMITRSQLAGVAIQGAFVIPPDVLASIIKLLTPRAVLRKAGVRTLPMPNGTITVPKMTGGSAATWVGEASSPGVTGPQWGQVIATAKKLSAVVPISKDLLRYAMAGYDASVRDNLVLQLALAEDIAGIRGIGTQFTPKGLKGFCLPANVASMSLNAGAYTYLTIDSDLINLQTLIEESNVPMVKPCWIFRPLIKTFLMGLLGPMGTYLFRDEMKDGTLLGWPFLTTTQIPKNLTVNSVNNCTEIYAFDANELVIYESRQLELSMSTEASYVDTNGQTVSAFTNDMTLIQALMAEDFQMDHQEGVAMLQGVTWSTANGGEV